MQPPSPQSRVRPGFAELFAALPVAVVVVDPDHRVAHANSLAEQLLNFSERLMLGQPLDAAPAKVAIVPSTNGAPERIDVTFTRSPATNPANNKTQG